MDIGSIFLLLALAVVVFLFVSRPFFEGGGDQRLLVPSEIQQYEHERSALLAERDRILNSLLELESDQALGKLPAEEFERQREDLMKSGASVLRRLDEINLQDEPVVSSPAPPIEEDELETLIAARKQARQDRQRFCPSCGALLNPGDRFCPSCGSRIDS